MRSIPAILTLLVLANPLLAATDASRDATVDQTIATLLSAADYRQVAISPAGDRVAWRITRASKDGHGLDSEIYVAAGHGNAAPIRITALTDREMKSGKKAEESDIAWSPDGRQLAFVSDSGSAQLFVADTDGHHVHPLTNVKGALSDPRWSPDGKKIAYLFIENAARKGGALVAMTPPSGDVEEQIQERRIALADVASQKFEWATDPAMYVYDYDWSPDSKSLVAETAPGSGENNYWIAQLYRFDLGSTSGRSIYKPTLQVANPRWSPDGKRIAFVEGLMSDEGSTGGDLFVMPADGGAATNVTPGLNASVTTFSWLPDSLHLLAGENVNGLSGFARVPASGGAIEQLWSGGEKLSTGDLVGLSVARDGVTTAAIRDSFDKPPEVWAGAIGSWTELTHANDSVHPLWSSGENINWTNDGFRVQGWLLYPKTASGKLPMVVQVHGGPSSGVVSSWPNLNLAAMVASGYAVLMPNPRGSYGQGEEFTKANVKDFGLGDFRDILAGVDAVIAKGGIDQNRVGIWGWSYGGYMTMWAVTQTHRFKAAVAGAGLVNWESYYGQNSIDQWMIPFFGASVYDDPWIYRRSSPIEFIKNAKTPTLVLVGDSDGEVPSPQSFEFWHALKSLGVKTKLVVYPGEGHHFEKLEHRRDVAIRLVKWFDENM